MQQSSETLVHGLNGVHVFNPVAVNDKSVDDRIAFRSGTEKGIGERPSGGVMQIGW